MEPLTAGAIATLAFTKAFEKTIEKFTEAALVKMDELRKKIWEKLQGKSQRVDEALVKVEQGDCAALDTVTKYLDVAMEDYPEFAAEIQMLAHEITLQQIQDNSSMNQYNYGGTNYQVKTGVDNTNFFGGTHNHGQK
ncbi:MAG: hypothetical protein V7K68_00375 [Nostoc sp.]|uniref:hypothetical protein n=1 Tax=Nostoc sp. TaxID=1180 RepID=UPI002FF49AB3